VASLPPVGKALAGPWRWITLAGAAVLCLLLAGLGGWTWWGSYQSRGQAELDLALARLRPLEQPQPTPEARAEAIKALQSIVERYPRLRALPQAAYQLGNLHYEAKNFEEARRAYQLALDKGASEPLGTFCRLGIGYAWEGQGEYARALAAFQDALQRIPKDFLREDALLSIARAHELLKQPDQAREAYQRVLKEFPQSRKSADIRARLASLESRPKP
jgi:tetratricopeptide (TPR) repeat protein